MTARAPSASALTTSLPRRIPPSSRTSTWVPTASATASPRLTVLAPAMELPDAPVAELPAAEIIERLSAT